MPAACRRDTANNPATGSKSLPMPQRDGRSQPSIRGALDRLLQSVLALVFLLSSITGLNAFGEPLAKGSRKAPDSSRSFLMGMTPCEFEHTSESVSDIYKIINLSCDMVAHHLDEGIPWNEALEGKPYHPNVEKRLKARLDNTQSGKKVYLAVTAMKGELNEYWGENAKMKREGAWKDKQLNDPDVIKAYTNFCNDLIERFHPSYFAYGIEVNTDASKNKETWKNFLVLAKEVYGSLKKSHPDLPVFVTFQLDEYWKDVEDQEQIVRDALPYTDYIAVSSYPYFSGYFDPGRIPNAWFSRLANMAPSKPFVVAETGFIAENFEALGIKGSGNPQWQNEYLKFLIQESNRLNAEFVVWYVPKDYDRFYEQVRVLGALGLSTDLFKVWKDSGLIDGEDKPRPAFKTWSESFAYQYKRTAN